MVTAMFNTTTPTTSSNLYHNSVIPTFSPPLPFHFHRRNISISAAPGRLRRFAVTGGPSPPGPDPPPPEDTPQLAGLVGTVTRIQDRVKIFLAVFFWMSLFFWVTVTDGRGKGKGKKGSRFK